MEEMYGVASSTAVDYSDKALMTPENLILPADYQSFLLSSNHRMPMFGSEDLLSAAAAALTHEPEANSASELYRQENASTLIKAKIASHPRYPRLLEAYIDCQKVGAPPEIASLLDELRRENDLRKRGSVSTCYAADPELDEFMEMYCETLMKYKSELSRPFDEATSFLNKIETQLSKLSTGASFCTLSDDGAVSSDEDFSTGEIDNQDTSNKREDQDLKDRLLRRFGSHISSLKLEFTKKKKKGKLPKEARQILLEWWNLHNKWPYPTEGDKIELAKATGLDQKQINNWFINQRKRHWKPTESMAFSVMDDLTGRFFTDE